MSESTLEARLAQLEQAKALVEADASYFPQIVLGVLPVFDDPFVELRQWVSSFVLLAFSSRQISGQKKEELALNCLERLATSSAKEEDVTTTKNFMQISTIIYPLLFRYVANNPQGSKIWENLSYLKSTILSKWDSAQEGFRINCIKFAQRVVSVQSPGTKDPRLVDKDDISLNLVLANHPLLNDRDLTAEAQALLDRLIAIPEDRPDDAILMTAAVNCLCILAKQRSGFTLKIINALMSYDTSRFLMDKSTTKAKLQAKFVDKTIKLTLSHLMKDKSSAMYGSKIHAYLTGRAKKPDEDNQRKRQASEPAETSSKKARKDLDEDSKPQTTVLDLPPGIVNLSTIFNLANDNALAAFDINQLPASLVTQIVLATLSACDSEQLETAIKCVRDRYQYVQERANLAAEAGLPDAVGAKAEVKVEETISLQPVVSGPFHMPAPSELSKDALQRLSADCMTRMLRSQATTRKANAPTLENTSLREFGLQKVLGGSWNKEAWLSIVTRVPARGLSTISDDEDCKTDVQADVLRNQLLSYVMINFRETIDFCASWLTEEWYANVVDSVKLASKKSSTYRIWCHKVLDAILPFLESKDRIFMRFLSDLPELDQEMISRIRTLCLDPNRSQLGYTTLQYLIMLRPPVRGMCLDLVEALYKEDQSEINQQEKILQKWRPEAIVKVEVTT